VSANDTLDGEHYAVTWSDPTDDIISAAHELTLRTSIATTNTLVVVRGDREQGYPVRSAPSLLTQGQAEIVSPNLTLVNRTTSREVQATMTFEETVYKTQPQWLASAFAVICLACFSIVPTYWGWWRLGRPVSMSPLEIARAFDAPLMQHADPNGTVADHLRAVGDMRVRYGSHATVVEERESNTATERISHRPEFENSSNTSIIKQGTSNSVEPSRPSSENGPLSDTPIVGPARPDDYVELQMLHRKASSTSRALSDQGTTTGRSFISSNPPESIAEIQAADSSSGQIPVTGPAPSRVDTRIEMRLKFAEE
jgi:hypothetical protein